MNCTRMSERGARRSALRVAVAAALVASLSTATSCLRAGAGDAKEPGHHQYQRLGGQSRSHPGGDRAYVKKHPELVAKINIIKATGP